jgi:hypothetical protein
MNARTHIPEHILHRVLDRSRRRCALCVHFDNDYGQKEGQIAHLDRDRSNSDEDNLAYLCLPHHDDYDTKRRQTKNLIISEVKTARDRLYKFIEDGGDLAEPVRDSAERPLREHETVALLSAAGPHDFQINLLADDSATKGRAHQIYDAMVLAGWRPKAKYPVPVSYPGIAGVMIAKRTDPNLAQAIQRALSRIGIDAEVDQRGNSFVNDKTTVEIFVSR